MHTLRQPPAVRVTTTVLFVLIAAVGVVLLSLRQPLGWVLGGVLAVVGVWGAGRALRVAVLLDGESLIVRGFFRTRTVARAEIASAARFPTLDLRTSDGGGAEISLTPFVGGATEGRGIRRKLDAKRTVEQWLEPSDSAGGLD